MEFETIIVSGLAAQDLGSLWFLFPGFQIKSLSKALLHSQLYSHLYTHSSKTRVMSESDFCSKLVWIPLLSTYKVLLNVLAVLICPGVATSFKGLISVYKSQQSLHVQIFSNVNTIH